MDLGSGTAIRARRQLWLAGLREHHRQLPRAVLAYRTATPVATSPTGCAIMGGCVSRGRPIPHRWRGAISTGCTGELRSIKLGTSLARVGLGPPSTGAL